MDVFEDFLGSPLLPSKLEDNYEVTAQLLVEMCDGGVVCNTEANALKDSVEVSSALGRLLDKVGLPGASPALGPSSNLAATLKANSNTANGPAIPWRKPNVRHTSNELYVDIVENLAVVFAPSGRPISARVSGSMLFTAKISGVPDLLLMLSAPGGTSNAKSSGIVRTMQLPVFHPCVRLARWKDHPGELSFVPPDGKFMLAGYETDLLPSSMNSDQPPTQSERIFLPATVDLRTGTNSSADFEARLTLNNNFPGVPSSKTANPRTTSSNTPFSFGSSGSGSSNAPILETVVVTIPFPTEVRSVIELKPSRGEANFNALTKMIEWKVPTKDGATVTGTATLTGTVTGPFSTTVGGHSMDGNKTKTLSEYYDDESLGISDGYTSATTQANDASNNSGAKKSQASKALMPRSIAVSFNVKGWLPSGIRVESLMVDVKKSRGLGDGVKPYKGVKYLTVSRRGVERRVS